MSRKMTKSDLSRADISLLINSEETKNTQLYGNLYDILVQIRNLKAITLEELKNRNLNHDGISALTYNKQTLIDNATKEWIATTDIIDNPDRIAICELCNAPNLRYECHIHNTHNNIDLLVGSECVNRFKIDGYINQKKQLYQIQKGQKIVQRRSEFYNHFPNYDIFISDAENYFASLPILLPFKIYEPLYQVIKHMRSISTKYINEGKTPTGSNMSSFRLFEIDMEQFNKLKNESDTFVTKNLNTPFICRRDEIDWLVSNNKFDILQQIAENNGIYTINTLQNIYSLKFFQKNMQLILNRNSSKLIKFVKVSENVITFSFNKFGYHPALTFSLGLSDFMRNIGAYCMMDDTYSYDSADILNISTIDNSYSNLSSILGYTFNMVDNFSCIYLIDYSTNMLFLLRKGDMAIRKFNIYVFMKNYSKYILKSDKYIINYLFSVIKTANKTSWITQDMQAKQGIDDKVKQLYKDSKEDFIQHNHINNNRFEIVSYNISSISGTKQIKIDFDNPEYISFDKNSFKIGNQKLNQADYAICLMDSSLEPSYHKGDLLLIQITDEVVDRDKILYVSNESVKIKKIKSEQSNIQNIFDFIHIPKRKLQAYGKILYCMRK